MKKYLFVGEERSERAKQMNVTWVSKRLCAGHLSKAVEALGINWDECEFLNVFEVDIRDIRGFKGVVIAMGRKVERELKKAEIRHEFIYHPATRGTVRNIENYKAHVKQQIGHIVACDHSQKTSSYASCFDWCPECEKHVLKKEVAMPE
jgi:hypothetical protein